MEWQRYLFGGRVEPTSYIYFSCCRFGLRKELLKIILLFTLRNRLGNHKAKESVYVFGNAKENADDGISVVNDSDSTGSGSEDESHVSECDHFQFL